MLVERAIENFERLSRKMVQERAELLEINSALGSGVDALDTINLINNINGLLSAYDVIIPALRKSLDEGVGVICSDKHFRTIIERYKETI